MSDLGSSLSTLFFPMLDRRAVSSVIRFLEVENPQPGAKEEPMKKCINRFHSDLWSIRLRRCDISASLDETESARTEASVTLNKNAVFINQYNGTKVPSHHFPNNI